MPTATGHTTAIRAKKVIGTAVKDTSGDKIGTVEDLVLDKQTNTILFAVVGTQRRGVAALMNPGREKISLQFEHISQRLATLLGSLQLLRPYLHYEADQLAVEGIMTDLIWAVVNTKVVSLHMVEQALDDTMGYGYLD
jgi:sporulation protein YlmC with PRC-barrel domain